MNVHTISFKGKPQNYHKIDDHVSRSAQPGKQDFAWLKNNGITDIIDFKTSSEMLREFEEQDVVKKFGMNYYNIPSYTRHPKEENIFKVLKIIDNVKNAQGKVHIHCKAGADRTGMYSFIYKMLHNLGTAVENIEEWKNLGHHTNLYPDLIPWTQEFIKKIKR